MTTPATTATPTFAELCERAESRSYALKLSAADLRHTLALMFQPAIADSAEMLTETLLRTAVNLRSAGVTERRLRNAASTLSLPAAAFEILVVLVTR
jgi:hypothetical protein